MFLTERRVGSDYIVGRGVPRGDAQDARASPPPSPAWKAGYEKRWGSGQHEKKNQNIFEIY
jgi:hypothetical protein